jgi:hypothetical protein
MGSWVRSDMRSQILSYLAITLKGIFFPTNPLKKTVRNFSVICGAVGDGFMSANLWFDRKRLWRGKCGQMGWGRGGWGSTIARRQLGGGKNHGNRFSDCGDLSILLEQVSARRLAIGNDTSVD